MSELLDFKRKLKGMGLCGQYTQWWNACQDKLSIVRLGTDSNGAALMADATAFGFAMSAEYIQREFGDYINGKKLIRHDGYTSELYVGYDGPLKTISTLLILLGCNCEVWVPKTSVCRLFVADSHISIRCDGYCEVEYYTDKETDKGDLLGPLTGEQAHNIKINYHTESVWKKTN